MAKQTAEKAVPAFTNGKRYSPREDTLQSNIDCWATVQATLKANKGSATLAQVQTALKESNNNAPFAKYCIRRGWLKQA